MRQEDLPKANAECVVCGKPYYRCEKCIKLASTGVQHWKLYCNTPQCYQIYIFLNDYQAGNADKAQTKDVLKSISEHSGLPIFISPYKELVDEILHEDVLSQEEVVSQVGPMQKRRRGKWGKKNAQ